MNNRSGEHRQPQSREPADPDHPSTEAKKKSAQGPIPYAIIWKDGEELRLF